MAKRESTDVVQVPVRMRESLRHRIEVAAKGRGNSINGEIIARLQLSFVGDRQEAAIEEFREEIRAMNKNIDRRLAALEIFESAQKFVKEVQQGTAALGRNAFERAAMDSVKESLKAKEEEK